MNCYFLSCFFFPLFPTFFPTCPLLLSFLLLSFLSLYSHCYPNELLLSFLLLFFLLAHCYFLSCYFIHTATQKNCYFLSCYFFSYLPTVTFFPVTLFILLPKRTVTFFPVTFFPTCPLLLSFLLLSFLSLYSHCYPNELSFPFLFPTCPLLLSFLLLFFLLAHCYFLSCYFLSCHFIHTATKWTVTFFPVSFSHLPTVTFFPVTFFPTCPLLLSFLLLYSYCYPKELLLSFLLLFFLLAHCYFLSCYFIHTATQKNCYFLSCYFFSYLPTVTFFPVTFFPTCQLLLSFLLLFFLLLFFLPETVTFFPVTFFPVTFFPCTGINNPQWVENNLGPDSIKRCYLTSIGNPIVEIRRSYDRLISTMGFPILARWHLYIEPGPCSLQFLFIMFVQNPIRPHVKTEQAITTSTCTYMIHVTTLLWLGGWPAQLMITHFMAGIGHTPVCPANLLSWVEKLGNDEHSLDCLHRKCHRIATSMVTFAHDLDTSKKLSSVKVIKWVKLKNLAIQPEIKFPSLFILNT